MAAERGAGGAARSKSKPRKRCPHPRSPRASLEKHQKIVQRYQVNGVIVLKVEDDPMFTRDDEEPNVMEIPPEISRDPENKQERHVNVKEEEIPIAINKGKSRKRTPPEKCPSPHNPQDFTKERRKIPPQEENLLNLKDESEEGYVRRDTPRKKRKTPLEIGKDGQYRKREMSKDPLTSQVMCDKVTSQSSRGSPVTSTHRPELPPKADCCSDPISRPSSSIKTFLCSNCDECFAQKSELTSHQQTHKEAKLYTCPECGKVFSWKSSLITHVKLHKGEKPFVCTECGKCFPWKAFLIKHQRTHTSEKPYPCSECGKSFTELFLLMRHQKSHTGEKPFSCSECEKSFSQKSDFERHVRIHTGEKPYRCSECGKCFSQKEQLITHHRSHTGVKPYICSECGKAFSLKGRLVIHQRVHTGENPYSCSVCGRGFKNKSNLARHERVHSGDRPYLCSECGRGFTDKSDLMRHGRVHSGVQPYSCSECGKRFSYKSSLSLHLNVHRKEKDPPAAE